MTQEQINELLKPRYIVENLYPGCEFNPGDILVKIPYSNAFSVQGFEDGMYAITEDDIDKFPYLVRKLEWWEERKPGEKPEYVKSIPEKMGYYEVRKVASFIMGIISFDESFIDWRADRCLPATSTDYNEYLQTLTHNQEP